MLTPTMRWDESLHKLGMADLQSKMEAHSQDIDRAKEQIHETTQKADSYITELTKRVEEYEKKHSNFEPAGQYLRSALDASRAATQKLKTQSQDLSERTVPVAIDGMQQVRSSLDELEARAVTYDKKYEGSRGAQAIDTLHHWVNMGRQHATEALEVSNDQLMKLLDAIGNMTGQAKHGAQVAVGESVRGAEFGDVKLGVSSKVGGVVQTMKELDERLGVSATAAKADSKVTGGLGNKVVAATVGIVSESVNQISDALHNAKLTAEQSEVAQNFEAKGVAVAEVVTEKKNEVKSTFNEGFEKGRGTIGMATVKTEEKVGQAKDVTQEKASQAKDKAGQMKDMAQSKASEAKEKAEEKVSQAKDATQKKVAQAKDKAGHVKDIAQSKASEAKEKAEDKVGQAKEVAQEKAGQAKDKAGQMKDMAQSKASEAKKKSEEKVGQAKDATQEKAGQAKDKAGQVKDIAQSKASEAKNKAEEKAGQMKGQGKDMVQQKSEQAEESTSSMKETAAEKVNQAKEGTKSSVSEGERKSSESVEQAKQESQGITSTILDKGSKLKDKMMDQAESAADSIKGLGARVEATVTKPKEPALTQEETNAEKGLEALKQTSSKDSEAAKTAVGTAREEMRGQHAKVEHTGGERGGTPGFKAAQEEVSESSK
ncbi:hypothetical protein PsorP6_007525 [Peronosclerospora sorghi]|uniref:Uncharacterized protein n=1 Tax=Peronosclerospora sorghi TaxID=230839 RepID=A0ACC0WD09_9STRA|nr:hypothetical protein PsorP6_007525 [Peronosclerospora sorghi]